MNQKNIYSIILVLFFSTSMLAQGDPCEHLLDPNRTGSIVLPDGKSWCDVARETGSEYAKCRCEHSKNAAADKANKQTEIDNMYAQRNVLKDKANEAKRNAYKINLTADNPNFENDKQAKIAYLEEYIRYNEQTIGLLKEMNQRFQMENNTKYTEQDVANARAEINRILEKEQSKTVTITGASGETNTTAQTTSRENDTQNNKESISQQRQLEAQQAKRDREAEAQRRVAAASQRQYEQTMDNNAQAKEYIKRTFNSSNVSQEQEAQNFYSNLAQWESRKDYEAIADLKKARKMYYKGIKYLKKERYQDARDIFDHLNQAQDKTSWLLEWYQALNLNLFRVLSYIENGSQKNEEYWQIAYLIKEEADKYGAFGGFGSSKSAHYWKNRYEEIYINYYENSADDFDNNKFKSAAENAYKAYKLSGEDYFYYIAAISYTNAGKPEKGLSIIEELVESHPYNDIVYKGFSISSKKLKDNIRVLKNKIKYSQGSE